MGKIDAKLFYFFIKKKISPYPSNSVILILENVSESPLIKACKFIRGSGDFGCLGLVSDDKRRLVWDYKAAPNSQTNPTFKIALNGGVTLNTFRDRISGYHSKIFVVMAVPIAKAISVTFSQ